MNNETVDLYTEPKKGQLFNLDMTYDTGIYMFLLEYISERNVYGNEKAIYEPLYKFKIEIPKGKFDKLVNDYKIRHTN